MTLTDNELKEWASNAASVLKFKNIIIPSENDVKTIIELHEKISRLIDAIRDHQKQLMLAAGYISATPDHSHKHPMEVLEWIKKEAEK